MLELTQSCSEALCIKAALRGEADSPSLALADLADREGATRNPTVAKFLAACPVLSPKPGLNKEWAAIVQDSDRQSCPVQKSSEL